jgi:hypothetical protein
VTGHLPLPTQDPFGRGPLVVTQLQSPTTGVVISGRFSLGWVGRLTPEQLDLVGLLLARRNNLQQLATDLGLSYNTLRARFDDLVDALGSGPGSGAPGPGPAPAPPPDRRQVLARLAAGDIDAEEAERLLRRGR